MQKNLAAGPKVTKHGTDYLSLNIQHDNIYTLLLNSFTLYSNTTLNLNSLKLK